MLVLGACADYLNHHETVTASAGNSVAHNKVVHITDPWPRAAANTRITGNGRRVDRVTKEYLTGPAKGGPSISVSIPGLAPPPNSPPSQ